MAISLLEHGDVVALGYDSVTGERGFLCKMLNETGAASVKGNLVSISQSDSKGFILQANEYDTLGVVAEAGVADGSEAWIWMGGSICQALYEDSFGSTLGNILIASGTNGRAEDVADPGSGLPAAAIHFKECGHVMETVAGGTDVLVLACLHFN